MRNRVGTIPDLSRLGEALARPGMDTRRWVSLAYAAGESVVDKDHGVFVDIILLPTGEATTARVGGDSAGTRFGAYDGEIHKDDELIVIIPSGFLAEGAVVVKRLWSASDLPPQEAVDNPGETLRVLEKDKTWRVITSGTGKVYAKSADTVTMDSPKVRLGAEDATEKLVLGNTYKQAEQQFLTQLVAVAATLTTAGTTLSTAGAVMVASPNAAGPMVTAAGASIISAATTLTTAANQFSLAYDTYLSKIANTK